MEPSPPVLVMLPSLTHSSSSHSPAGLFTCLQSLPFTTPECAATGQAQHLPPGALCSGYLTRSCALCGLAFIPEVLTLFLHHRRTL